jgi:hypothetical protein
MRVFSQRDDDVYFDVVRFLEYDMLKLDPLFHMEIVPDEDMGVKHAEASPSEHKIRIAESVYCGAIAGNRRDRGTCGHEVGHYIMHDSSRIRCARTHESVPRYQDPEWQAKVFQGAFLAPEHIIREMSVDEVVSNCGISWDSAQIQVSKKRTKR